LWRTGLNLKSKSFTTYRVTLYNGYAYVWTDVVTSLGKLQKARFWKISVKFGLRTPRTPCYGAWSLVGLRLRSDGMRWGECGYSSVTWRHEGRGTCDVTRDVTRGVALLPRSLACPDDVVASLEPEPKRVLLDMSWRSWRWNWRRNRQ